MQIIAKGKRLLGVLVFIIVLSATACGEKVVDMRDTVVSQNTSSNVESGSWQSIGIFAVVIWSLAEDLPLAI